MSFQYKKNVYTCERCDAKKITVDRDFGVTPFMIRCDLCSARMRSACYNCDQGQKPTHEWYRPAKEEWPELLKTQPAVAEHVRKGGLVLRVIPEPSPVPLWADPIDDMIEATRLRFFAETTQQEVDKIMADMKPSEVPAKLNDYRPEVFTARVEAAIATRQAAVNEIMEDRKRAKWPPEPRPPIYGSTEEAEWEATRKPAVRHDGPKPLTADDVKRMAKLPEWKPRDQLYDPPVASGKGRTGVLCSEDGCHRTEDCGPFCRNRNAR